MKYYIVFACLLGVVGCGPVPTTYPESAATGNAVSADPNTRLPPVVPGVPVSTQGVRLTLITASNCGNSAIVSIWPYGSWHPQTPETYKLTMPIGHSQMFPLNAGKYEITAEGQGTCRATLFPEVTANQTSSITIACTCQVYGKQEKRKNLRTPASEAKSSKAHK